MSKKIRIITFLTAALILCVTGFCYFFRDAFTPSVAYSCDTTVGLQGNCYLLSDLETELKACITELEKNTEQLELSSAQYRLYNDGTGTARISFSFDRPDTVYSRIWESLSGERLSGLAELWISLPDASIYHVNYNYGHILGKAASSGLGELKELDIYDYYKELLTTPEYAESLTQDKSFIKITLQDNTLSASAF